MTVARLMPLICFFVTGCDPISGISTDAKLTVAVDYECLDRTLRSVAGVGMVARYEHQDESLQIMPYRGKVVSKMHLWQYGPDQTAILQVTDDGLERSYTNSMKKMGEPWPASRLDAFVPLMKRVNAAVQHRCGLPLSVGGRVTRN